MKKTLGYAVVAVTLFAALEGTASAGPFRLRVEDVGAGLGVVITDNGPGDINPLIGAVTFSGAIGANFTVNVTTGVSQPLIGGVIDVAQLDLNSVNVATTGAGTLRLTLEDAGYVGPTDSLGAFGAVGGTLVAPAGSSFQLQSWANGDNLTPAFGPDQPPGPIGAIGGIPVGSTALWSAFGFLGGPGAFSSIVSTTFDNGAVNTFALFTQVVITFSGPGSVSFDTNVQVVPEPASLLLLSTGVAAFGFLRRRKGSQSHS